MGGAFFGAIHLSGSGRTLAVVGGMVGGVVLCYAGREDDWAHSLAPPGITGGGRAVGGGV